jgi:hypothetical protein
MTLAPYWASLAIVGWTARIRPSSGDGRAVERHVEVGADEDPLARHPFCGEIVDRLHTK